LRTFTILFFTGLRLNEVQELKIIDIVDFSKENYDEARANLLKLVEENERKQSLKLD
jgi:hypothetical protein